MKYPYQANMLSGLWPNALMAPSDPFCRRWQCVSWLRWRRITLLMCVSLLGCTAVPRSVQQATDTVLSVAGLTLREKSAAPPVRQVSLRMEASYNLNAATTGQGVATVVRVYKLRSQEAFLSAPYRVFGDTDKEKTVLGSDLSEIREFVLLPGQTVKVNEKLSADAAYLGVAALFHKPSPQRWRMAFNAVDAEQTGLVLGVHACAMTSSGALPIGMRHSDAVLLSTAPCSE